MLPAAWAVFRKELVEAIRDRRTLILGLLMPLLVMPAVTLGLPALALREEARLREAPARVAVRGGEHLEGFLRAAEAEGVLQVTSARDPAGALRRGTVHAVLEGSPAEGEEAARLRLLYDAGSIASLVARQKIDQAVARFSLAQVQERLAERGIRIERLLPLELTHVSIRPGEDAARGQLATILPFFMTIWMLLGGQYAALDLGAGERERGTLPGLLLTPPDRLALVLGKFGTVFALATASVVLVVGAVLASLRLAPPFGPEGALPAIPWGPSVGLVGVGLVFAAFLSAAQLLLSLAARSVREAQQLFTPVYLLVVGSVLLAQILPEWGQRLWVYAVPGLNGAFLLRGFIRETLGSLEVALAVGGLLALTATALALGAWVYRRERTVSA